MKVYFQYKEVRDAYNFKEARHRGCDMVNTTEWYDSDEDDKGYYLNITDYESADITFEQWELDGNVKFDFNPNEVLEISSDMRIDLIEQLILVASASELAIEFDKFYFENRLLITNWIINGGNSLRELVESASNDWWDKRVSEQSPSPREYALKLLSS